MITSFFIGAGSSLAAMIVAGAMTGKLWPWFRDRCLYSGVRINGTWEIIEIRGSEEVLCGQIVIKQHGATVKGQSRREVDREGRRSNRKFCYDGRITGQQLTLIFRDLNAKDFDVGTYVFRIFSCGTVMQGLTTFNGKAENQIIAESRTLKKLPTA